MKLLIVVFSLLFSGVSFAEFDCVTLEENAKKMEKSINDLVKYRYNHVSASEHEMNFHLGFILDELTLLLQQTRQSYICNCVLHPVVAKMNSVCKNTI